MRFCQAKKSKADKGKGKGGDSKQSKFSNPMDDDGGLSDEDDDGEEEARMCATNHFPLH